MINEKTIKVADLIDVSDKTAVSNIRVGIYLCFFLRNGKLVEETTAGKTSGLF